MLRQRRIRPVDDVVDSYWIYLYRNRLTNELSRFKRRLASNQKAAEAEAIAFSILWNLKLLPGICEDPSRGGPDFICSPKGRPQFLVKVTSLENKAVSTKSTLPEETSASGGQTFAFIGAKLIAKAKEKAEQLANRSHPGILFITSDHPSSDLLMGEIAAEKILISETTLNHIIGGDWNQPFVTTDLSRSVFLRAAESQTQQLLVVARHSSIAAIVLVSIRYEESILVGVLHPQPAREFDPSSMLQIPFVRLATWPVSNGLLRTEWIHEQPGGARIRHSRFVNTNR